MKFLGIFFLTTLATLSIWGFSSQAHQSHTSDHDCVFSSIVDCSEVTNPISSVLSHISSFQNSTQTSVSSILLLLAFVFLSALFTKKLIKNKDLTSDHYLHAIKREKLDKATQPKVSFLSWLSTLFKREPIILRLAR